MNEKEHPCQLQRNAVAEAVAKVEQALAELREQVELLQACEDANRATDSQWFGFLKFVYEVGRVEKSHAKMKKALQNHMDKK